MPLGDEARMPERPDLVLELVDNLIVISGDVLDAELVVFHGVRERPVPARETLRRRAASAATRERVRSRRQRMGGA